MMRAVAVLLLTSVVPLAPGADSPSSAPPPAHPGGAPTTDGAARTPVAATGNAGAAGNPAIAAPSPFLGVTLDHPLGFDADQGLLVTGVVSKSTFDHLGVRVGDHLLSVNGKTVTSVAEFSVCAESLQIGQELTVRVRTDDATRTISGVVEAVSRPREISQKTQQLANEVEELRTAVQGANNHASMQQSLLLLKQLEADLPTMIDEFHQRYPQGQFDISIHIDILSDRTAKNPQAVPMPPLPAPSHATPSSGSTATTPASSPARSP